MTLSTKAIIIDVPTQHNDISFRYVSNFTPLKSDERRCGAVALLLQTLQLYDCHKFLII